MSHFVTVKTQIKDIEALRGACAELNLEVQENSIARGYGSTRFPAEFVIKLKGPFDIAVNRQAKGVFSLSTDWWAGHVENEVGKDYGRLLQLYGVHKATREAHNRGLRVQRTALQDGTIKLTLAGA